MKYDFSKYEHIPAAYVSDPDGFAKPKKAWSNSANGIYRMF